MTTENNEGKFNTHLLTLEEVWYVRDNLRHLSVQKVISLVKDIEEVEEWLEERRKILDAAVERMNLRRNAKGWK